VAILLATSALSAACKPYINRFDATPPAACRVPARLSWEAGGDLAIRVSTEPVPAPRDACGRSGSEVLDLTLIATRNGEATERPLQLARLEPGATEPIAFDATELRDGRVFARGSKNLKLWKVKPEDEKGIIEEIVVTDLVACGGRTIRVSHAGKTTNLFGDGKPSRDLVGTPLAGDWELSSELTPSEKADHRIIAKGLKILASIQCREGSP
jgi:hypothetical protein